MAVRIYIDGEPIEVDKHRMTGEQLYSLVQPKPQALWLDIADAQDRPVALTQTVALTDGMRFFTDRPRAIYLDKQPYTVHTSVLTETDLRTLPTPPVPDDHGIWKDIPDDLDDPIEIGEIVTVVDGDRFFSKPLPHRELHITVNRRPVTVQGARHTGLSIKESAVAQGVPIKVDFLLSRKTGPKFRPVGDDEYIRVHNDDEFRANDGDDNS